MKQDRYMSLRESFNGELFYSRSDRVYFFNGKKLSWIGGRVLDVAGTLGDPSTNQVSAFYNEVRFPNFDGIEDYASIYGKGRSNSFTRRLDDEIPWDARMLEVGCGTGQLSLFLGRGGREVHAIDVSSGSLLMAEEFREANELENTFFMACDVLDMPYRPETFDIAISNGVLHHTIDPKRAFKAMVSVLKPGGYAVVGLYHKYGRIVTKIKQRLGRVLGEKIGLLDHRARALETKEKRNAWVKDQFFNPLESSHTPAEVNGWFDEMGMEFVNLIPHLDSDEEALLAIRPRPNFSRLSDMYFAVDKHQIREGGFFIIIGRKR